MRAVGRVALSFAGLPDVGRLFQVSQLALTGQNSRAACRLEVLSFEPWLSPVADQPQVKTSAPYSQSLESKGASGCFVRSGQITLRCALLAFS